jgi:hypothetical protein
MRVRLGPKSVIVATAHKIACIVYHLLTHRTPFRDFSAAAYEQGTRDRDIAALRQKSYEVRLHALGVTGINPGHLKVSEQCSRGKLLQSVIAS